MARKKYPTVRTPSVRELARTKGVPVEMILAAIRRGELRAYRYGERKLTVEDADFEAWPEACRCPDLPGPLPSSRIARHRSVSKHATDPRWV